MRYVKKMNISSIGVQTKPDNLKEVIEATKSSDFCAYHLHKEIGPIVLTLKGSGIEEEMKKLKKVQAIPKVISAEMIYNYAEDELEQVRDKLDRSAIPEWLNDPNMDARVIKYHGDLKKRL